MSATPPNSRSIESTANDWFVRSDKGLSPAEERELAFWLAADPQHEAAFLAAEETWHRLGSLPPVSTAETFLPRVRSLRWRWLVGMAAAAVMAIGALVGWRAWNARYGDYALVAQTEIGGLSEYQLPDGSLVHLNTDTRLTVSYSSHERRVDLTRGEAHFSVAKNKDRPFIVSAAGVQVRAVGTAFNVRLKEEALEVLVTEGRVRVSEKALSHASPDIMPAPAELGVGQKATIALNSPASSSAPEVAVVPALTLKQALAWQEKRLEFDETPLALMVDEINRYSHEKIVIADPQLRAERFGGSFPAGDTATIVRMLAANFGIAVERQGDTITLRSKP